MHKVVYNDCWGGFRLSRKACEYLNEKYGVAVDLKYDCLEEDMERHDPRLVEVVEVLGDDASGFYANLKIMNIDTPVYRIIGFDGKERVESCVGVAWTYIKDDTSDGIEVVVSWQDYYN